MLFEINQICFNESDYVTLHSVINIMKKRCQNGAYNAAIMVLRYYYLAPVRKGLLQAHHDRCCSAVKLLRMYLCYFSLLNYGKPLLNNIFFPKIMCNWKDLH